MTDKRSTRRGRDRRLGAAARIAGANDTELVAVRSEQGREPVPLGDTLAVVCGSVLGSASLRVHGLQPTGRVWRRQGGVCDGRVRQKRVRGLAVGRLAAGDASGRAAVPDARLRRRRG